MSDFLAWISWFIRDSTEFSVFQGQILYAYTICLHYEILVPWTITSESPIIIIIIISILLGSSISVLI